MNLDPPTRPQQKIIEALEKWTPTLTPKQKEFFNCYKRFNLVSGPRLSGKSFAVEHRVMRHLWETQNAYFGVFSNVIKTAKDGGVWDDFIRHVIPEWLKSNMVGRSGMPIGYTSMNGSGTPGPRVDAATRTVSLKIRNYHGGESELALFSLPTVQACEAQLKQRRFSGIWFVELTNFNDKKVFTTSIHQLRMPHLRSDQHIWIADTNPSEEGQKSWIWKIWYKDRLEESTDPDVNMFRKQLNLLEIFIPDNPLLDPVQIAALKGSLEGDPVEYERMVLGKWVAGHGTIGKHFADILIEEVHFRKDCIDINPNTDQLINGWDMGEVNHAAVTLERRIVNGSAVWLVIDELVKIREQISIGQFAYQFYQKMLGIEKFYGREFRWKDWADSTNVELWKAASGGFDAAEVFSATEGRVQLMAAMKPKGSIKTSIQMIRRLLRERRLFVGENCPNVIEMLWELKETETEDVSSISRHKHVFDALRYPIFMESQHELMERVISSRPRTPGKLISVG